MSIHVRIFRDPQQRWCLTSRQERRATAFKEVLVPAAIQDTDGGEAILSLLSTWGWIGVEPGEVPRLEKVASARDPVAAAQLEAEMQAAADWIGETTALLWRVRS